MMAEQELKPDGWIRVHFKEAVEILGFGTIDVADFMFEDIKFWDPLQGPFVCVRTRSGRMYWFNQTNVRCIEVQCNSEEYANSIDAVVRQFRDQLGMG